MLGGSLGGAQCREARARSSTNTLPHQALMKLIKHSREAHLVLPAPVGTSNATLSFSPAVGQLLGIDSNGVLEISNVFPLPAGSLGLGNGEGESETRGVKGGQLSLFQFGLG